MALRQVASEEDRDELTKEVNDLDKVYLENMKKDGVDPELLKQFRDLSLLFDNENKK